MKKGFFVLILFIALLTSCSPAKYSTQFYGYFDTVISVEGYFDSEEDFNKACGIVTTTLREYDSLFDIYDDGELKKLNEERELVSSPELVRAIEFGVEAYNVTNGYCNIAMGNTLSLWHDARESDSPYLPTLISLQEAQRHSDISNVKTDGERITLDGETLIDMGAVAKGFVSDVLRQRLTDAGFDNMYVNLGGNVVVLGNKDGNGWNVGIRDPLNESGIADAVNVNDACLVTSGSYQRFFEYNGKKYHHIISPDTLYPSDRYLSVTVLYENGAWADVLSTALFNMSIDDGKEVLEKFDNIGVMWITSDNEYIYYGTLKK
ncbi:MAG: FAD:protein FMN transferase [Ruminococcaceae bacterium]|nr:FAD:protein FMN transferase [Oscillospiraceae bacterium]